MEIKPGTIFDTDFEIGCKAVESPDKFGNFGALDSEDIVCEFSTMMVIGHPDHREPILKPNPEDRLGTR